MVRFLSPLAAALVMASAGALLLVPARAQDAPHGDSAAGRKVYLADGCYECHGRVGEGGAMNGPAPILAKTKLPFAAFTQQLRNPVNDMPPYPTGAAFRSAGRGHLCLSAILAGSAPGERSADPQRLTYSPKRGFL